MKKTLVAVLVTLGSVAGAQVGPIVAPGGGGSSLATPVSIANGGTGSATGDGLLDTCTDSVGTDSYACSTATTCPASLAASRPVMFTAGAANTGAATFAYCGLAAKAIVKTIGGISTALADNDILAKQPVLVRYNATDDDWKMISAISNAPAGGGLTVGGAITSGTANRLLYEDASNLLAESADLTYDATTLQVGSASTASNSILKMNRTIGGASATDNFFNLTGTTPTTLSADTYGSRALITSSSASAQNIFAGSHELLGTYTGTAVVAGSFNQATSSANVGGSGFNPGAVMASGVVGTLSYATGVNGNSYKFGVIGKALAAANRNVGVFGDAGVAATDVQNFGVVGMSRGHVSGPFYGGYFLLGTGSPTTATGTENIAALVADNGTLTNYIFLGRDGGTKVFSIADGGATTVGGAGITGTIVPFKADNGSSTGNIALFQSGAGATTLMTVQDSGPVALAFGAAVASDTALPVPTGNVFHVTGTTTITSITATNAIAGMTITLIFDDVLTFTDGSNLKLAGDFVTTADDTITLVYDGTNFYEVARSIN